MKMLIQKEVTNVPGCQKCLCGKTEGEGDGEEEEEKMFSISNTTWLHFSVHWKTRC